MLVRYVHRILTGRIAKNRTVHCCLSQHQLPPLYWRHSAVYVDTTTDTCSASCSLWRWCWGWPNRNSEDSIHIESDTLHWHAFSTCYRFNASDASLISIWSHSGGSSVTCFPVLLAWVLSLTRNSYYLIMSVVFDPDVSTWSGRCTQLQLDNRLCSCSRAYSVDAGCARFLPATAAQKCSMPLPGSSRSDRNITICHFVICE